MDLSPKQKSGLGGGENREDDGRAPSKHDGTSSQGGELGGEVWRVDAVGGDGKEISGTHAKEEIAKSSGARSPAA